MSPVVRRLGKTMQCGPSLLSILFSPHAEEDSGSFGMPCRKTEYPQSAVSSATISSDPGISGARGNKGVSDLHLKSVLDTKLGNLYPSQRLEEPLDADCTPEDPPDEDGVPLTPCPTCNMSSSHLGSLPYSLSDLSDLKPERRLSTFSSFKSYVEHTLKRRL